MTPERPGPQAVPAALAAELAGRAWGGQPVLYLMEMAGGRCELDPLPVPGRAWRSLPLHEVITVTAAGIRRAGAGPADPCFVGAAVRFEDWDLPWPLLGGRALLRAWADFAAGRAGTRPDRIRSRFILAAGRDGTSWQARQQRHSPLPRVTGASPGEPLPPAPPAAWAAIRHFTRAVVGPEASAPEP